MDEMLQQLLDEEAADRLDAVRATTHAAGGVLLNDLDAPAAPAWCDCGGDLRTCPCDDARESGEDVLDRETAHDLAPGREPLSVALARIGAGTVRP